MKAFIYTPYAPSHGAAKNYVRNVNIWVIIVRNQCDIGNITSRTIVHKKLFAREVDSRYSGPRSRCGQAMQAAKEYLDHLQHSEAF